MRALSSPATPRRRAPAAWLAVAAILSLTCSVASAADAPFLVRQNAWTPDMAPRAVGELAPRGQLQLEVGYGRTFARTGASRVDGGTGQSPSEDTLQVRIAHRFGAMTELSSFAELGLSNHPGAADMQPAHFAGVPWLAGVTLRLAPELGPAIALVGGVQLSLGQAFWLRDISRGPAGGTAVAPATWSVVDADHWRTSGADFFAAFQASLAVEFKLGRAVSLQLGGATGTMTTAAGLFSADQACATQATYPYPTTGCGPNSPDQATAVHIEAFVMPTIAATVTLQPFQAVLTGWWLAPLSADQQTTPAGLTLALRARL